MRETREIFTNPGERYKVVYAPQVQKDGTINIVATGKEDLQAYYNSQAEGTDIKSIERRLANGDLSCLNKYTPFYGDFTKMPKTLADYMQIEADCNALFGYLPAEIRQRYGNDVNNFLARAGNEDWMKDCMPYFSDEAKAVYLKKETEEN